MREKIAILGSGSWPTALAKILTDKGFKVNWWMRNKDTIHFFEQKKHNPNYLSSTHFDTKFIQLSNDLKTTIQESDWLVFAIPSVYVEDVLQQLDKETLENKKIISAIKGFVPENTQLLNEYLAHHFDFPIKDYTSLLGPCHAEEVAAEKLSYLTFSGIDTTLTKDIAAAFSTEYLNTRTNQDIWGVQYAAILKNIYALGAGIAHGLDYGDNFLSVFIANAAKELTVFLNTMLEKKGVCNVSEFDFNDSVYLGDLLVTCYSLYSRNRTFGNMIGKGYSVQTARLELAMIPEGYTAAKAIDTINQTLQAKIPMASIIYTILWAQMPAKQGFKTLESILQ